MLVLYIVVTFLLITTSLGCHLRSTELDENQEETTAVATLEISSAAFSCTRGLTACPPGTNGPGGCYSGGSTCNQGLICSSGLTACPKGNNGPGGCYSGGSTCNQGLICTRGLTACPKGNNGPGGCYSGGSTCNQGLICSSGLTACPPGTKGKGGCYSTFSGTYCSSGKICYPFSTC